jgi:cytochrome b
MVIALLLSLSALVGTGLMTHEIATTPARSPGTAQASLIGTAPSEPTYPERERCKLPRARKPGQAWKETHEILANIVLVLAGFHICGVLFSSIAHWENLVRSMITGRKRAAP